jgi:hypothetical protein
MPFANWAKRDALMKKAALNFPSKERLVLATSFGNTVRAFEDYPRVMYGFESIRGWSRLNAIMPKDFREAISNARSLTDLWANIWFLSLVIVGEFIFLAMRHSWSFWGLWIPACAVLVAIFASWQARVAAEQWGECVKAGFDVFLPELCKKLGYKKPEDTMAEREFWYKLSQGILYRHPPSLDKLNTLRLPTIEANGKTDSEESGAEE